MNTHTKTTQKNNKGFSEMQKTKVKRPTKEFSILTIKRNDSPQVKTWKAIAKYRIHVAIETRKELGKPLSNQEKGDLIVAEEYRYLKKKLELKQQSQRK